MPVCVGAISVASAWMACPSRIGVDVTGCAMATFDGSASDWVAACVAIGTGACEAGALAGCSVAGGVVVAVCTVGGDVTVCGTITGGASENGAFGGCAGGGGATSSCDGGATTCCAAGACTPCGGVGGNASEAGATAGGEDTTDRSCRSALLDTIQCWFISTLIWLQCLGKSMPWAVRIPPDSTYRLRILALASDPSGILPSVSMYGLCWYPHTLHHASDHSGETVSVEFGSRPMKLMKRYVVPILTCLSPISSTTRSSISRSRLAHISE